MKCKYIQYRRSRIRVDYEKTGVCQCCRKKPKKTDMHHYKYEFPTKLVKKNPKLALKNTIELCMGCHAVGDALRKIEENPSKAYMLVVKIGFNWEYLEAIASIDEEVLKLIRCENEKKN